MKDLFENLLAFTLPPALSRREREKRSPRLGKAMAANCSVACGFYKIGQRLFLLPWGEGQDEGEAAGQFYNIES